MALQHLITTRDFSVLLPRAATLQHLITTRDFSVLLPRAAKSELEDLLFQSKNDRLLFAYFGTTIPISLTRCL